MGRHLCQGQFGRAVTFGEHSHCANIQIPLVHGMVMMHWWWMKGGRVMERRWTMNADEAICQGQLGWHA